MSNIIPEKWQFEALSNERAELGESPVWSAEEQCVWWVDITGRKLLRTDATTGQTQVWNTPEQIGFCALTAPGKLVVGMETGLFSFDASVGNFDNIYKLETANIRFNDATTDAAGNLWAGTMALENVGPVGTLYRITPNLEVTVIQEGLMIPNGLAVDFDSGRLYFSDSHPDIQTIWVAELDVRSGAVSNKRTFVSLRDFDGRPDGGALDAMGNYWISGVSGGVLHAFSPDATHLAKIQVPVESPTKIAFGGPDFKTIFITSKTDTTSEFGGRLVTATPGIAGRGDPFFG